MESKSLFKSKGMMGNLLGVLIVAAGLFGVTPDIAASEETTQTVTMVGALVAHLVGAYGRWTATTTIGG